MSLLTYFETVMPLYKIKQKCKQMVYSKFHLLRCYAVFNTRPPQIFEPAKKLQRYHIIVIKN